MAQNDLPQILRTTDEVRAWSKAERDAGRRIGFVPTMGALHDGHLSLVTKAKEYADTVIASIFVNPAQFAPGEDFDTYPRAETSDLEKLASVGCRAAFCPNAREIYPEGDATRVYVEGLSPILDGVFRPHFFGGVATVVSRLFCRVMPDVAVFGEKDYQQLLIIKRMTKDLGLPIDIIGAPTRREPDGLAMSSRNQYLSIDERKCAGEFAKALQSATALIAAGETIETVTDETVARIKAAGLQQVDYVEVRDADTLAELEGGKLKPGQKGRLLAAAWMGKTRLIDNLSVNLD